MFSWKCKACSYHSNIYVLISERTPLNKYSKIGKIL